MTKDRTEPATDPEEKGLEKRLTDWDLDYLNPVEKAHSPRRGRKSAGHTHEDIIDYP